MWAEYAEILDAMGEPRWYDEHAVPRYVDFHPTKAANIYASEVALLEIACQGCDERFLVCASQSSMDRVLHREWERRGFPPHFGDPPRTATGCCAAGPTMSSTFVRVVERWVRDYTADGDWRKVDRFDFEDEEVPAS